MIIRSVRREGPAGNELRARVVWEHADRASNDLYFRVEEDGGELLSIRPEPFVIATLLPAMRLGEKTIRVEGELCPHLTENLYGVMRIIRRWHGERFEPVAIDAAPHVSAEREERRATALFFSGGLDSTASLLANKRAFPPDHPGRVRDCITVDWFSGSEREDLTRGFPQMASMLGEAARSFGVGFRTVATNLRVLREGIDVEAGRHTHGAYLAAVAHALGGGYRAALIASADVDLSSGWGSHPALDPYYSSWDVRVIHHLPLLGRLEKYRILMDEPGGLRYFLPCNPGDRPEPTRNCGKCEKCLRRMVGLLSLGGLQDAETFSARDVTSRELRSRVRIRTPVLARAWEALVPPLRARGRDDLADEIGRSLRRFRRRRRPVHRMARKASRAIRRRVARAVRR